MRNFPHLSPSWNGAICLVINSSLSPSQFNSHKTYSRYWPIVSHVYISPWRGSCESKLELSSLLWKGFGAGFNWSLGPVDTFCVCSRKRFYVHNSVFTASSTVHTRPPKTDKEHPFFSPRFARPYFLCTRHAWTDSAIPITFPAHSRGDMPVHINKLNLRFQKPSLWRAFSKTSAFDRINADRRRKRIKKYAFWLSPWFC